MANITMKDIQFPGLNNVYKIPEVDSTLTQSGAAADAKKTGDELSDLKQDFNEYHPDLGSGYSAQILSTVFIEDEVPYNFRTSGGSADIGDREYDEIVGVSMPINQLVKSLSNDNWSAESGVTATYDNGVVTISSATSGNGIQHRTHIVTQEHKYFATMSVYGASGLTVAISGIPATSGISIDHTISSANTWQTASKIISCGLSGNMTLYALARGGTYENVKMKDIRITDLTLLLGTTIADYVYGLEQSTAGAGVTWLKHHFPKIFDSGYIPYTAGEMQSVSGLSAHRMTGFNQFDKSKATTGKFVNNNGALADDVKCFVTDYIRVLPNTAYYVNHIIGTALHTCAYIECDSDKNVVGWSSAGSGEDKTLTFTTGANTHYIRVNGGTAYIDATSIHLHWDGERDGQYEEYKEYEYALDDSVVLRGKLELDSNNNLRANGDRYLPDGTVDRRYTEITVAESNIESVSTSSTGIKYATINISTGGADTGRIVNSKGYKPHSLGAPSESGCIRTVANSIYVYDNALTDLATAKSILTGMVVVYQKATATTETAEPYQTPQIVDDWGTEEYVSTSLVPVGHDTKYANNLRAKLEMSPDSPEEDGDYIVRHNNGENQYVALGSTTTIQGILDRLTALENA